MVVGECGAAGCIEPWTLDAHREALGRGIRGTMEDYRRFGVRWGFPLELIKQPVTVWQGELDTLVPLNHAQRLAELLPAGRLRTVPAVGPSPARGGRGCGARRSGQPIGLATHDLTVSPQAVIVALSRRWLWTTSTR
jgi:hypothetical protein